MSRAFNVTIRFVPGERWLWNHSDAYRQWRLRVAFRQMRSAIVTLTVSAEQSAEQFEKLCASFEQAFIHDAPA